MTAATLRAGAAGLTAAGLLSAGAVSLGLAGRPTPVSVFVLGFLLAGLSLPAVVRHSTPRARRAATAGMVAVLVGFVLVALFNVQVVLVLADWTGFLVWERTLAVGRRAVLLVVGAGLATLGIAWGRAPDDLPVRLVLLAVGGAGMVLAFTREGRSHGAWYLALGALWVYLGLTAWLDSRKTRHA